MPPTVGVHWATSGSGSVCLLRATLHDGNLIAIGFGGNLRREHHPDQIRERVIGRVQCSPELSSRNLTERYLVPLRDLTTFATLAPLPSRTWASRHRSTR
jgi:hypothetical protein